MTAPRVDIFTIIHKALRKLIYDTGSLLERTNFADAQEKDMALSELRRTLGFLDEHMHLEDNHAAELISEVAPSHSGDWAEEHREHAATCTALEEMADELTTAQGPAAVGLGVKLCKAFNALVAQESIHMNTEETVLNEALWAARSDAELAELRSSIQAAIPPPRFAEWLALMIPTINHQELVGVLTGMKKVAPPEVFQRVTHSVQATIGARWKAVAAELPD